MKYESTLREILYDLFEIPKNFNKKADLTIFIRDSIDVGELVAEFNNQTGVQLEVSDFRNITTLEGVLTLIENKNETTSNFS